MTKIWSTRWRLTRCDLARRSDDGHPADQAPQQRGVLDDESHDAVIRLLAEAHGPQRQLPLAGVGGDEDPRQAVVAEPRRPVHLAETADQRARPAEETDRHTVVQEEDAAGNGRRGEKEVIDQQDRRHGRGGRANQGQQVVKGHRPHPSAVKAELPEDGQLDPHDPAHRQAELFEVGRLQLEFEADPVAQVVDAGEHGQQDHGAQQIPVTGPSPAAGRGGYGRTLLLNLNRAIA